MVGGRARALPIGRPIARPPPLAAPVVSHRIRRGLGRLEGRLLQAKPIVFGDENFEVVTFLERFSEGANLWWVEVTGFRHQVLIA